MIWSILADVVMLLHGLFIVWAVAGGLAVWRWPRAAWLHLPALAWAGWITATGGICPLTPLEVQLRLAAGQEGFDGGFIEHYVGGLIYPEGLTRAVQVTMATALVLFNGLVYALAGWRHRQGARRRRLR